MTGQLEREIVRDYPLIHLVIGGIGNATFLVGSLGDAVVRHQRRRYSARARS